MGCKNEMTYSLLDDSYGLHGYVIFRKKNTKNLCYFDLGQNKIFEIPSTNVRMPNGFPSSYDFFIDEQKKIMINYIEKNNKPSLQFIELKFSNYLDQKLLCSKEVESIKIDGIVDLYKYLYRSDELYYYNLYGGNGRNALLINMNTLKTRKLFSEDAYTPRPVDFFDNKYLALGPSGIYFYDNDDIETVINYRDPFIKCVFPRYSTVLKKILFRKEKAGNETIAIFDIDSMQIIDTGINPIKYDREDSDKDKFHFFGENCILYARYKENISGLIKYFNPVEYIIYDYIEEKEIGYIKNCQLEAVYDFFPAN